MFLMTRCHVLQFLLSSILAMMVSNVHGQVIEIQNYSVNTKGQVQLKVNSSDQNYYLVKVKHHKDSSFQHNASMVFGAQASITLSESLKAYPKEFYQVSEYPINSPEDSDGDGINDVIELNNIPTLNPINPAQSVNIEDGSVIIDNREKYKTLSVKNDVVQWSEFLNGKEFVKFLIVDIDSSPKVYFINTKNHELHADFGNSIGVDHIGSHVKKGQILYLPNIVSENGTKGVYVFNYSNGRPQNFDVVQLSHELLAANMPFLENNLSYYVTDNNEDQSNQDLAQFENSRTSVIFERDIYAGVDYLGLNQTEGYGFFRKMADGETPGNKDIVLYESLPNELPRVGGIMTSVVQTPLSHVNLRAIQDNVPNAFVRDPLSVDSIAALLNHYIYYRVEQEKFVIREASLEEVNSWFDALRPKKEQLPPLNLNQTNILPLDDITFSMYDAFGAKCSNVATMRGFDFAENTIPNGYGVPFYFYQEFMKHNRFFEEVNSMINDHEFNTNLEVRTKKLKAFRKKIRAAEMPIWMMKELTELQNGFDDSTSIRCRSSSNNEDLPGFNGAGLYTSKTQHPHEGHISKSIKQVYASLWNLRAFDEREFYHINHFFSSMGVLCHPNYSFEKANGVGVTVDPVYNTNNTFYLNTQIDEELITNPDSNSVAEELLLYQNHFIGKGYLVIQHSNHVPEGTIILNLDQLRELRNYLKVIHSEFEVLYDAVGNEDFAMDIEYKITSDNRLIIKQTRPWVIPINYKDSVFDINESKEIDIYPNPAKDYITVKCNGCKLSDFNVVNVLGQQIVEVSITQNSRFHTRINLKKVPPGIYILTAFDSQSKSYYSKKFIKTKW